MMLIAGLMVAACGSQAVDPQSIGDPEQGREIFMTGAGLIGEPCQSCHSLDGSEKAGDLAGPTIMGIAETANSRISGQTAVEYLRTSIVDPGACFVKGYRVVMDAGYKFLLAKEDIDDLVA